MKPLTRGVPPGGVPVRGSGAVQETIFPGIVFLFEFALGGGGDGVVACTCVVLIGSQWVTIEQLRVPPAWQLGGSWGAGWSTEGDTP